MRFRAQGMPREVFEAVSNTGVRWLFVTLLDDGWAITRDGQRVAAGTGERRSLESGVDKFMALTHAPESVTICDPVIQKHLDRIHRDIRLRDDKEMVGTPPSNAQALLAVKGAPLRNKKYHNESRHEHCDALSGSAGRT